MSINLSAAVRRDLDVAEHHFRKSCEQVFILDRQLQSLTDRINDTDITKTLRYQLRLRASVVEGVRNMYYEFAAHKATTITQLQRLVLAWDDNDEVPDEPVSQSGFTSIDADDSMEFC